MAFGAAFLSALLALGAPAVPGGCSDPASENAGLPGCYLTTEMLIPSPPEVLYWHIVPFDTKVQAEAATSMQRWSIVAFAHGRWWLYIISPLRFEPGLPAHHVAGPFRMAKGKPIVARFMESWFPAGMRTRIHTHSGPEAFYVIEGEQCTETPTTQKTIVAGESFIVSNGPHLQAAPKGRRSMVLILAPAGEPWMRLSSEWTGTDYCAR